MPLGRAVLEALQDHVYHKNLNYFDPNAAWMGDEVQALSDLARTLRDFALGFEATHGLKLEAMRLAKTVWEDARAVYQSYHRRAGTTAAA